MTASPCLPGIGHYRKSVETTVPLNSNFGGLINKTERFNLLSVTKDSIAVCSIRRKEHSERSSRAKDLNLRSSSNPCQRKMPFHSKRLFLESMRMEKRRKFAQSSVRLTNLIENVNNNEPCRSFHELFDRCWARSFSDFDKISNECWDKCWARAFSDFDKIFDKCWDECRARAYSIFYMIVNSPASSNFDEIFYKCWDTCWARAFSNLVSDKDLDPLQQDVTDASHQDELAISQDSRREEEGDEVMTDLPEEIVMKIIAMGPFLSIFKAVGLSKAWRARFSPSIKSPELVGLSELSTFDSYRLEDGEDERSLATSFQKQVIGEWSKSWETFAPVFIAEDHLVTYSQKSCHWRVVLLSFLPEILLQSKIDGRSLNMDDLQIEGALLYISHGICYRHEMSVSGDHEMYVADILTQRWKHLPPPPTCLKVCSRVVSNTSPGTYKVILFSSDNYSDISVYPSYPRRFCSHDRFSAHVYDSTSETWSTERFSVTLDFFNNAATFENRRAGAAYLNGVLYMVTKENVLHLLAFNMAERTLDELILSSDWVTDWVPSISLLVCNDQLLMVVAVGYCLGEVQVLEVDLHSLQLKPLSAHFRMMIRDPRPVSDGNCISFMTSGLGRLFRTYGQDSFFKTEKVLAYNVNEDAWSIFQIPAPVAPFDDKTYHLICSSFQPSLSAFVPL